MKTSWQAFNADGLSYAEQSRWGDASASFERALAVVEALDAHSTVTPVEKDDLRARLFLNIGQCQFHMGVFSEARRFAERSLALRVALYGEDSLVVARTRSDLAVILSASGLPDDALSLLERSVVSVERKRGEASAHLLPLLTNAARLLSRSAPDRAAPYLARLKALSFAHQQAANAEAFPPSEIPAHSFGGTPLASGSDDHALRMAVAQTVDLLRSTPRANVALSAEPPAVVNEPDTEGAVEVSWEYDEPLPPEPPKVVEPKPVLPEVANVTIDDTLFDLVEPPPPTLSAIPESAKAKDKANANPLGFEVHYGIPSQLNESLENPTTPLPEDPSANVNPAAEAEHSPAPVRSGMRSIGGARRGSAQVVAMNRLWIAGASIAALGAGAGAVLLIRYLRS